MADLSSVIKIVFSGSDQVSQTIRGVGGSLSDLDNVATNIAAPFADLAKTIEIIDAALVGLATVIGIKAVEASNKYGQSVDDLNRFLGEGEGKAGDYRKQFEELSLTYGHGINEIIASTADWEAANFNINQSLGLTKTALDYAAAGDISVAEATKELKSILAGMAIPLDQANAKAITFGDTMVYIGNKSSVGFKEVAEAIALVAPNINIAGTSFTQMSSVASVLADSLQSGTLAGHAINVMIGQLTSPSKQAQLALTELGVVIDKNGISQESFWQILNKLSAKWPELTAAQKNEYAQMLLSAEEAPRLIAIMNNWGNVIERVNGTVSDSTGKLADQVSVSLGTTKHAFESFSQSLNLLLIDLGQSVDPAVAKFIKALTGISSALNSEFKQVNNPFQPLIDLTNATINQVATLFEKIAANLPAALSIVDFSGLTDSFSSLFGELNNLLKAFFGNIDITTVDGLAKALQEIVNTGEMLVRTTQGIIQAFEPFATAMGEAVRHFNELDKASKVDFGKFIGDMQAIVSAGGLVGVALIALGKNSDDLRRSFDVLFGGAKVAVNALQVAFDGAMLGLLNIKKTAIETGISFVEFSNKLALTDAAKAQNQQTLDSLRASLSAVGVTMDAVSSNLDRNKKELEQGWAQAAGDAADKTDQLSDRVSKTSDSFNAARQEILKNNSAMQDWSTGLQQASTKIEISTAKLMDWSDGLQKTNGHLKEIGVSQDALSKPSGLDNNIQKIQVWDESLGKLVTVYGATSDAAIKATGSFAAVGNSAETQAQKVNIAAQASENYRIKMAEIASNEKIKTIEAVVKLNVAELDAQTKQVEATFKSIDNTVSSTGNLVGSLFGNLVSAKDTWTKLEITEQIELENDRRERALKLQEKLTEAQIDAINARTRAINRGDAMITVDGSNMAPHIEAILWEFFRSIQIKVNAEFSEFLLGLPTATA